MAQSSVFYKLQALAVHLAVLVEPCELPHDSEHLQNIVIKQLATRKGWEALT